MQLVLLAPFRTQFQLDTEFCLANWEEVRDLLAQELTGASIHPDFHAGVSQAASVRGFLKYESLETDHSSPFTQPIVTFRLREEALERFGQRYFSGLLRGIEAVPEGIEPQLSSLTLFAYDNTIAMLQAELKLPHEGLDEERFVVDGDTLMTAAMERMTEEVGVPSIERLATSLVTRLGASSSPKIGRRIVRRPSDFLALDDVKFDGRYGWPDRFRALLWVNRTLLLASEERSFMPVAARWARLNGHTEAAMAAESYECIQPGNNLFYNMPDLDGFLSTMRLGQYFFIIFDTFSDRLRRFYVKIGPWRDVRSISDIQRRAARISAFFDFARNEYGDLLVGLQADRKHFAEQIFQSFEMDALIDNVREKYIMVDAKIRSLLDIRGQARQKVLQFGVIVIGALQIFDLLLNVSLVSRSAPHIVDDGIPSVFSLGLHVSPNLLQNFAFIAVLIVAFLLVGRRTR